MLDHEQAELNKRYPGEIVKRTVLFRRKEYFQLKHECVHYRNASHDWDTFKQDNYSTMGGDGGCRVGEV